MNNKTKMQLMSKANIEQAVVFLTTFLGLKVNVTTIKTAKFDSNKPLIGNLRRKITIL